jgi:hypothetical protein
MYIVAEASIEPKSNIVFYKSIAGQWPGQQPRCGLLPNGSLLQGYLQAVCDGLQKLYDQFGKDDPKFLDILIENEDIAEQFRNKKPPTRLIPNGDDELWTRYFHLKREYDVKIVNQIAESPHLVTIWKWSSEPPFPTTLPESREESDQRLSLSIL